MINAALNLCEIISQFYDDNIQGLNQANSESIANKPSSSRVSVESCECASSLLCSKF